MTSNDIFPFETIDFDSLDFETLTTMLINEMANIPYDTFIISRPMYDLPNITDVLQSTLNNSFNEKSPYKQVICD